MTDINLAILISGYGKNVAKKLGLKTFIINRKEIISKQIFEKKMLSVLLKNKIDILCLAGFMEILSKEFIKYWDNKILNIHPSLLPLFPGLDTHKRVLDSGMSMHGATVHLVTEKVDKGPILSQGVVRVFKKDDETKLKKRVSKLEYILYPKTISEFIKKINNNRLKDIDLNDPDNNKKS